MPLDYDISHLSGAEKEEADKWLNKDAWAKVPHVRKAATMMSVMLHPGEQGVEPDHADLPRYFVDGDPPPERDYTTDGREAIDWVKVDTILASTDVAKLVAIVDYEDIDAGSRVTENEWYALAALGAIREMYFSA